MANPTLVLLLFCLIFMGVSLTGGLLPLVKNWSSHHLRLLIGFAAGILLGTAFVHMLPVVVKGQGTNVGNLLLVGFLGIYLLEKLLMLHPCEVHKEHQRLGMVAYLGFSFHSMIDGLAMGSSLVIPQLAPAVFFAIIAHKFPTTILEFRHFCFELQ